MSAISAGDLVLVIEDHIRFERRVLAGRPRQSSLQPRVTCQDAVDTLTALAHEGRYEDAHYVLDALVTTHRLPLTWRLSIAGDECELVNISRDLAEQIAKDDSQ